MKINSTKEKDLLSNTNEQIKLGHLNHMGGVSYDIANPITQLRTITSSCFFGEPMYYHDDKKREDVETKFDEKITSYLSDTLKSTISIPEYHKYSAPKLIEVAIDESLEYSPEETLIEAVRLRNEENIRTTPQVILVRAANHPKVRGTGLIAKYAQEILKRTDEAAVQLAYQIQVYGKPIPNALKKVWKKFLESRTEYEIAKYRMESHKFKTLDVVNLVHASGEVIDKLMRGTLKLSDEDTWESIISNKGSTKENWEKAINVMGHMALLRNLRNLHESGVEPELYLEKLINTAKNGKQLPFRYYSAYVQLKNSGISGKVLDAVEKCLEISLGNLPKFEGKVMSLCDNSGSAQETRTSSLGKVRVADIGNITAVITGTVADHGYVGVFGDKLEIVPVRNKSSIFDQVDKINQIGHGIGQGTENGIWMFFDKAINEKEHWDHIFVYSDMQAGHGGLYGLNKNQYSDYTWQNGRNIDVAKLIKTYREKVNPNVHVYLVQIAGQRDTLVPEFYDKTYILGGWGDGILKFAHEMSNKNAPQKKSSNKRFKY